MGIAVAVLPDLGAPQVGITITGLHPSTPSTISVQTSTPGTYWQTVRGADHLVTTGGVFLRDFVPPLNVPTTYHLVVHAGNTIPTPTDATITVTSTTAWVQDPLRPAAAVPVDCWGKGLGVTLLADSFETITRDQPANVAIVQGARLPVASVSTRIAPSRVQIHMRAKLPAQATLAENLRTLFATAGPVVLRGLPATIPLDPVAHVVAVVQESPVVGSVLGERTDWQLDMTQVRPTTATVAVAWWTYSQVGVQWAGRSYNDAKAARPGSTYLDWARDPSKP